MHLLTIHIPARIEPSEREERFEDPLIQAFAMGSVEAMIVSGGSLLAEQDGKVPVESCNIEVTVSDLERGLAIVHQVLIDAGAPSGTTVQQAGTVQCYRLGNG
jgi:hypothetical protein